MGNTITIPLHEGDIAPWKPEPAEQPEVFVRGLARRGDESWIVTLFLVNGQEEKKPKDATWIFQPELSLRSPDGAAIFRRRAWADVPPHMGAEERELAMRYRNQIEFAVGHGVSVRAEPHPDRSTEATRIRTSVAPVYELPPTTFTSPSEYPSLSGLSLDMKTLAETPADALPATLTPIVETYATWIATQQERITSDASLTPHREIAASTLGEYWYRCVFTRVPCSRCEVEHKCGSIACLHGQLWLGIALNCNSPMHRRGIIEKMLNDS
jgi:hypothetical protein